MLLENADYFVRVVPMVDGFDGAVRPNDDGTFSVYISAGATREQQLNAMDHELFHMEKDHFYRDISEEEAEAEAAGETFTEKCEISCETPLEKCVSEASRTPIVEDPLDKAADAWMDSWAKAMAWAEKMRSQYGESGNVPLYQP